jgi:hypothetical protein
MGVSERGRDWITRSSRRSRSRTSSPPRRRSLLRLLAIGDQD